MAESGLSSALADAVRVGGRGVLDDPSRLRGLIEDGLGANGRSVRTEVLMLEALSEEGLAARLVDASDDQLDEVGRALREARGIDVSLSRPVLELIRSATSSPRHELSITHDGIGAGRLPPAIDLTVEPPPQAPVPSTSRPTASPPRRRSPALAIAITAVAVLLAAVVGFAAGRVGHDDKADTAISTGTGSGTTIASTSNSASPPASDQAALAEQLRIEQEKSAQLAAQVQTATGQLDQANQSIATLQGQLQQAPPAPQPTTVDLATLDPLGGAAGVFFKGELAQSECDGFTAESCAARGVRYVELQITKASDGGLLVSSFQFLNDRLTRNGQTLSASGPVENGDSAFTCQGAVSATLFSVQLVPSQITVRNGTAAVSAFDTVFRLESGKDECKAAHFTYVGTLAG